jgi:hypothetical protein
MLSFLLIFIDFYWLLQEKPRAVSGLLGSPLSFWLLLGWAGEML